MADSIRGFVLDDSLPGWVKGWAVIRHEPWHFARFFRTPQEAEQCCNELGEGYEVAYGSNRLGTDDFIVSTAINVPTSRS